MANAKKAPRRKTVDVYPTPYQFSREALFEAQLERAIQTSDWDFIVDAETCME
jgi:hypothetical protein